jgi:predicted nucleic acid-binding Zn ribbon protein
MSALNPDRWQEVSPYLDEVLAMPAEERTAWLASLRVRQPELASLVEAFAGRAPPSGGRAFSRTFPFSTARAGAGWAKLRRLYR